AFTVGVGVGGVDARQVVVDRHAEYGAAGLPVVAAADAAGKAALGIAPVADQVVVHDARPAILVRPLMVVLRPAGLGAEPEPAELRTSGPRDRRRLHSQVGGLHRTERCQRNKCSRSEKEPLHFNPLSRSSTHFTELLFSASPQQVQTCTLALG